MAPSHSATWSALVALLVGGGVTLASCYPGDPALPNWVNTQDGGGGEGASSGGCGGAPTLAAIQDGIFTASCAFGSCHGGANPAAGLDLTKGQACGSLLNKSSCVFASRTRVVPGHPEQSYLYHKVAGDDLGTNPDGPCAGLANGNPSRMPLGGVPLCQGQIDQIKAWISAGASCDDTGTDAGNPDSDAGSDAAGDAPSASDGGTDGADASGPIVTQITSSMSIFNAGQQVNATVVLGAPAPGPGVTVTLTASDPSVLAVPSAVFVAGGSTSAPFAITGMRPGHATVQASSGGGSASLDELVLGLYIAEIYYRTGDQMQWVRLYNATQSALDLSQYSLGAGHLHYTETAGQLAGTVGPGACFVVGGPTSDINNGYPHYGQVLHIVPNIPKGGSTGAGVAIFSVPAASLTTASVPLDAVVYGDANSGHLLARDGTVAVPVYAPDVYPGDSLMLLGGTWVDQWPTAPNTCGL